MSSSVFTQEYFETVTAPAKVYSAASLPLPGTAAPALVADITNEILGPQVLKEMEPLLVIAENAKQTVDREAAWSMLAKLSYGMRRASELHATAVYQLGLAEGVLKREKGQAALVRSYEYVDRLKIKMTEGVRDAYVEQDEGVLAAIERVAFYQALVIQVKSMSMEFQMALSSVKAAAYGYDVTRSLSGSAATTGHE